MCCAMHLLLTEEFLSRRQIKAANISRIRQPDKTGTQCTSFVWIKVVPVPIYFMLACEGTALVIQVIALAALSHPARNNRPG